MVHLIICHLLILHLQNSTANFYLAVFSQDMQSMIYGGYYGGGHSREHVDGGTSRFDKNGKIYQAVCAGCQGNNDFPTTPNVVSNTNGMVVILVLLNLI